MRPAATEVWRTVHAERRRLAADLEHLSDEQWRTPSLCPGWDVHDVVAHLVDTARTSRVSFVRDMLLARFDFDRANEIGIARAKRPEPRGTLNALVDVADLTNTPPANLATRLVEAIVHGEDVRRPLGITGSYPQHAVVDALTYLLRTPVGFGGGRERAATLRLVDRESGTSWGHGDDVEGAAIDLLLAVSGRPVPRESFSGSGAARFAAAMDAPPA